PELVSEQAQLDALEQRAKALREQIALLATDSEALAQRIAATAAEAAPIQAQVARALAARAEFESAGLEMQTIGEKRRELVATMEELDRQIADIIASGEPRFERELARLRADRAALVARVESLDQSLAELGEVRARLEPEFATLSELQSRLED